MKIKLIYIAGPYTSKDRWQEEQNVREAESVGYEIADGGAFPVIPHSNTRHYFSDVQAPEFWYEATLELMKRCDAVFALPGWAVSKGTTNEIGEAARLGIPVFFELNELYAWLRT